jgi:hypothetical protein
MKRNMFCDKQAAGRAFDGGFEPKQTFGQNSGALKPRPAHYREITKWMTVVTATVAASLHEGRLGLQCKMASLQLKHL